MAPRDIEPILVPSTDLPQHLFDELRSAIKGPVVLRSDPAFFQRSRTFNGKLKSLARVLVSPLDAQDVSAAVIFCSRHNLSPSVRASGYGIAGWAVAGDIIIDLTLIRDVEVEPPLTIEEGEKDWVSFSDIRAENKGIGRGGGGRLVVQASSSVGPSPPSQHFSTSAVRASVQGSTKRCRDERDDAVSAPPNEAAPLPAPGSDKHPLMSSYDAASHTVASFLRGPPLPLEQGETPREPPTNRRRVDSPEPFTQALPLPQDFAPSHLFVPALEVRQLSNESATSSSTASSSSAPSMAHSTSATSTAPSESPEADDDKPAPSSGQEPFGYMTDAPSWQPRPPMYGATNPFGPTLSNWTAPSAGGTTPRWSTTPGANTLPLASFSSAALASLGAPSGVLSFGSGGPPPALAQGPLGPPAKPVHAHAYVTFGAGMRQKELDTYTAEHALEGVSSVSGCVEPGVVPYHVPSSAHPVGSSIMLLAGFGFLSRMHGLSIDNLVEVEMVLADGRIVVVNKEDDPDLWWAVRGAGPAFGIATRYKARAFPVPVVFAGNLIYRFHRATAPSLIKHVRDCIKGCPRELYANVLLTAGPADKDSLVVIQMCYVGPKEKGVEYLHAISAWDGERCLLNEVNEKSYLRQQDSVAQVLRGKAGRQWFIRSALITSLPDEVIHKTVMQFSNTPIGCTWLFELAGGAIGDFEDTCLPKEQREATWTVAALHQWEMGIDDPRCITSAEEWILGTIGTVATGGPYPTFLGRHEPPTRTMACYGRNWARLAELKRRYDPDCLFKNNLWPLDKHGKHIELLANEPPSP